MLSKLTDFFIYLLQDNIAMKRVPDSHTSATSLYHREASQGTQLYEEVTGQLTDDPVGRPVMHVSAEKHVTGEAIYCDDMPRYKGKTFHKIYLLF